MNIVLIIIDHRSSPQHQAGSVSLSWQRCWSGRGRPTRRSPWPCTWASSSSPRSWWWTTRTSVAICDTLGARRRSCKLWALCRTRLSSDNPSSWLSNLDGDGDDVGSDDDDDGACYAYDNHECFPARMMMLVIMIMMRSPSQSSSWWWFWFPPPQPSLWQE